MALRLELPLSRASKQVFDLEYAPIYLEKYETEEKDREKLSSYVDKLTKYIMNEFSQDSDEWYEISDFIEDIDSTLIKPEIFERWDMHQKEKRITKRELKAAIHESELEKLAKMPHIRRLRHFISLFDFYRFHSIQGIWDHLAGTTSETDFERELAHLEARLVGAPGAERATPPPDEGWAGLFDAAEVNGILSFVADWTEGPLSVVTPHIFLKDRDTDVEEPSSIQAAQQYVSRHRVGTAAAGATRPGKKVKQPAAEPKPKPKPEIRMTGRQEARERALAADREKQAEARRAREIAAREEKQRAADQRAAELEERRLESEREAVRRVQAVERAANMPSVLQLAGWEHQPPPDDVQAPTRFRIIGLEACQSQSRTFGGLRVEDGTDPGWVDRVLMLDTTVDLTPPARARAIDAFKHVVLPFRNRSIATLPAPNHHVDASAMKTVNAACRAAGDVLHTAPSEEIGERLHGLLDIVGLGMRAVLECHNPAMEGFMFRREQQTFIDHLTYQSDTLVAPPIALERATEAHRLDELAKHKKKARLQEQREASIRRGRHRRSLFTSAQSTRTVAGIRRTRRDITRPTDQAAVEAALELQYWSTLTPVLIPIDQGRVDLLNSERLFKPIPKRPGKFKSDIFPNLGRHYIDVDRQQAVGIALELVKTQIAVMDRSAIMARREALCHVYNLVDPVLRRTLPNPRRVHDETRPARLAANGQNWVGIKFVHDDELSNKMCWGVFSDADVRRGLVSEFETILLANLAFRRGRVADPLDEMFADDKEETQPVTEAPTQPPAPTPNPTPAPAPAPTVNGLTTPAVIPPQGPEPHYRMDLKTRQLRPVQTPIVPVGVALDEPVAVTQMLVGAIDAVYEHEVYNMSKPADTDDDEVSVELRALQDQWRAVHAKNMAARLHFQAAARRPEARAAQYNEVAKQVGAAIALDTQERAHQLHDRLLAEGSGERGDRLALSILFHQLNVLGVGLSPACNHRLKVLARRDDPKDIGLVNYRAPPPGMIPKELNLIERAEILRHGIDNVQVYADHDYTPSHVRGKHCMLAKEVMKNLVAMGAVKAKDHK